MNISLFVFAPSIIAFILSLIILPRMRVLSNSGMFFRSVESLGEDNQDKILLEIGGIAFLPILLLTLSISIGLPKWFGLGEEVSLEVENAVFRILQVFSGCSLLYVVGLKNDIHGTGINVEFLTLLASAIMFPMTDLWISNLNGLFGIHELSVWTGVPITVFITLFITEMITLLDDLDGLGVGIVTIFASIFFGFCVAYNFTLGALVSSSIIGISLPYVGMKFFHTEWKKTLLGHSGSYVLGYLLSYLIIALIRQSSNTMPDGMLLVVFGIVLFPVFDVIRTLRKRVRDNRAMLTPDRNFMHHQFIRMGIPAYIVPFTILFIILSFAAINTVWVVNTWNLTMLCILDLILYLLLQSCIAYLIKHREDTLNMTNWNIEFGREAWEANVPVETIVRKQQTFGTMGLPNNVILGKELDFIPDGMNTFERITKRLIDIVLSGIMLLLTSPLFLLCYILIKCSDGGDAIYQQERIGRYGRPFKIYKFRSMRTDAEIAGPALSHASGEDDPRLTNVGRFLRAHHLDELPQLWNVFMGDMAFVGYRPERKFYIDKIVENDPRYTFLYQIRPGVTSYATLYNGYTDTMEKMLRRLNYDLFYLEHRSFWFDLQILWLTFISILFGKKF